jgi:uncharacterized oxidoreductase
VAANLRGHDSHGVMRVGQYLNQCGNGEIVPGAELTILRELPSILAADGHWGFGQVQAQRLTRQLIDKTRQAGVAVGTLVRSAHIGRLGEYCEMAADAGLVSMLMANTHANARRVAPPGGVAPRLGTNPLAFGVPNGARPLILDFGTSATAEGKVRVKRIAGMLCPDGWLLDSQGQPSNDPAVLYGEPPGTIRPMGGDQPYKGFGLALIVEVFAGALSGGPCIREVPPNQNGNCLFMLLADPAALGGADHLACEVAGLAEYVTGCPRADGAGEILLPGDPERRTLAQRQKHGIPLDEGNWNELVRLAARLEVALPKTAEPT